MDLLINHYYYYYLLTYLLTYLLKSDFRRCVRFVRYLSEVFSAKIQVMFNSDRPKTTVAVTISMHVLARMPSFVSE